MNAHWPESCSTCRIVPCRCKPLCATRRRVRLVVEIDLDPVPGFGHTAESWRDAIERSLVRMAEHYRPTVTIPDTAAAPV